MGEDPPQSTQHTALGLMHLHKLFSELAHPAHPLSQNEQEQRLYNMLPLFCKVRICIHYKKFQYIIGLSIVKVVHLSLKMVKFQVTKSVQNLQLAFNCSRKVRSLYSNGALISKHAKSSRKHCRWQLVDFNSYSILRNMHMIQLPGQRQAILFKILRSQALEMLFCEWTMKFCECRLIFVNGDMFLSIKIYKQDFCGL